MRESKKFRRRYTEDSLERTHFQKRNPAWSSFSTFVLHIIGVLYYCDSKMLWRPQSILSALHPRVSKWLYCNIYRVDVLSEYCFQRSLDTLRCTFDWSAICREWVRCTFDWSVICREWVVTQRASSTATVILYRFGFCQVQHLDF